MKGFVVAIAASAIVFSAEHVDLFQDDNIISAGPRNIKQSVNTKEDVHYGNVFVTNKTEQEVYVEWTVSVARNCSSTGGTNVELLEKNYKAGDRFNWMVSKEDAKTHPVYEITVVVFDKKNGNRLAHKKMTRSMSYDAFFGYSPADNLHVTYFGGNKVSAYIGK